MAFLGVLFAFWINDWGERKRDREFVENLFENLVQDVKNDSVEIAKAIRFVRIHHDSLQLLINKLDEMKFSEANNLIHWTYFSYYAFDPTMETFESIFGGDMKLLTDFRKVQSIKKLFHVNDKLKQAQSIYFDGVEEFRNTFVCPYDPNSFDFKSIPNRIEFWNRINFLNGDVMLYYEMLVIAQKNYNQFLQDSRTTYR